jgi:transcriptional regulator with XRE-family HTH domain
VQIIRVLALLLACSPQVRTYAQTLRELRAERGLSQAAVAILADLDVSQVSRLERGLCRPRRTTIVKLARALGIGADRMRQILENPPGQPHWDGRGAA